MKSNSFIRITLHTLYTISSLFVKTLRGTLELKRGSPYATSRMDSTISGYRDTAL